MVYKHAISTIVPSRNVRVGVEHTNHSEAAVETEVAEG
jgi:sRNA-binding regulator protein Hfq